MRLPRLIALYRIPHAAPETKRDKQPAAEWVVPDMESSLICSSCLCLNRGAAAEPFAE